MVFYWVDICLANGFFSINFLHWKVFVRDSINAITDIKIRNENRLSKKRKRKKNLNKSNISTDYIIYKLKTNDTKENESVLQ